MRKGPLLARLSDFEKKGELAVLFLVPFLVVLISLVLFFILREERMAEEAQLSELKESAGAFYEQIAVARFWNAKHGGVYVEVTPETQSNRYLDVQDRDIVSIDAKRYTKINPAYMTRQLSEIANQRRGNKFRIVGFRPVNPANAPDAWESEVLRRLENAKEDEAATIYREEDGKRFFKYLVPLRIEQPCLTCHAKQGYRRGELKGGVIISIPMEKFDAIRKENTKKTVLSLSAMGLVSVLFTALITGYLSRRLSGEIRKNIEREKLVTAVELAGATAHEMRQPMTVVHCMLDIMREKARSGEPVDEKDMDILHGQCLRMNDIIKRQLNITHYRTKKYGEGVNIMDLDASAAANTPGRGTEGRGG
jgi:hypothetical protein